MKLKLSAIIQYSVVFRFNNGPYTFTVMKYAQKLKCAVFIMISLVDA